MCCGRGQAESRGVIDLDDTPSPARVRGGPAVPEPRGHSRHGEPIDRPGAAAVRPLRPVGPGSIGDPVPHAGEDCTSHLRRRATMRTRWLTLPPTLLALVVWAHAELLAQDYFARPQHQRPGQG